jgi:hypothetical protein
VADLANLRISVDSRDVKSASNDLNAMKSAAGTAEGALGKFGSTVKMATASQRELNNAIKSTEQAYKAAATYVADLTMQTKRLGMSAIEIKKLEIATAAANAPTLALRNSIREAGAEYLRAAKSGQAFAASGGMVGASAGAQRAGMQQLSYQIGDVTQQFALGTSPMVIFAQQGGQVVQALSMMRGGASGLIGFLAGPWGTVFLGVIMILGTFFNKTKDAESATLNLSDAINFQKMSNAELGKSIDELNAAQQKANRTSFETERQAYNNAAGALTQAEGNRQLAISHLEVAKAAFTAQKATSKAGLEMKAALGSAVYNIESEIKALEGKVVTAKNFLKEASIPIARREAAAATDGAAAATLRYDKAELKLRQTLLAKNLSQAEFTKQYTRELVQLNVTKEREIQLAKEAEKEANKRQRTPKLSEAQKQQIAIKETIDDLRQQVELSKEGVVAEEARLKVELKRQGATEEQITTILDLTKQLKDVEEKRKEAEKRTEYGSRIDDLNKELYLVSTGMDIEEARLRVQLARQGALENEINAIVKLTQEQAALKKAEDDRKKLIEDSKKAFEDFNNIKIDINFDAIFGDMGKAMGGVVNVFDQMLDRQEKYNDLVKLGFKDDAERSAAQQRNARLQINQYANLVSAAKGFFKQGTTGYKAMEAAEKAFRLFELAMAAKSAAVKIGLIAGTTGAVVAGAATETAATAAAEGTKTGVTLAGAAARIPVKIAEGAASMFASLGPLGFAAVAAMVGVMAAFGFGGGGSRTAPKYNTGTGTVMGDTSAQSESLTKSIERLAEIDRLTMRYSAQMAGSLKNIEMNIGGLTSLLVRTGDVTASGANVRTGTSGIGDINKTLGGLISKIPVLGTVFGGLLSAVGSVVNALFGTRTSIVGQGLSAVAQTMADIVSLGFEAENFTNVQRRSRFLGVTVRTRYSTETTEASDEVNRQFTLILKGFYDAISAASNPLGLALNEVQERLNSFVVNIGQIDLQGLTGQEIQEKLTAVFGAAADSMARAAITGLDDFQQVGEGYFETIVRVASGVEQAQQFLRQLGVEAIAYTDILNKQGDVTTEIIRQSVLLNDASAGIAGGFAEIIGNADGTGQELFDLVLTLRGLQQQISATGQKAEYMTIAMISAAGGLDAFQSGLQSFYDDILTDSERSAIELARLTAQFQSLGVAMPASKEAFKTLIQSIDITTAAGQSLYGSLIALTPAFVDLIENTTVAGEQIDLSNQRRELEIQLMEATGNAAGALAARRQLELASIDETLRALQQQIYDAQDAKAASEAAAAAAKAAADEQAKIAEAAAKLARDRAQLEITLMEAQGNAAGALAARRELELAGMDESLRALQRQIYTAQDAAKAAEELAAAQAKAADLARERRSLEIQLMEAQGNVSGALAAQRALELEGMDASLRALKQQIWAAEDAAKATQELAEAQERAADLARQRQSLEIQLMEAQGNSAGALAAQRALELAAMDESLRGLQSQIYAAQDAAKAAEELAQAQERAANLSRQRQDLEIQLMEAQGNSAGALAARRELELAGMNETLRALQSQIYAAEDAAKAAQELADAQAAQATLARQRQDLEIQLMEALGNSTGALNARRELELAGMDETLRALQRQIYTAEDAAKATQELADAQARAADLARQRRGLEIRLLELQGNATAALSATRQLELEGTDETLRALLREIHAAEDAKAASEAAAEAAARAAEEQARALEAATALNRQRRELEIELLEAQGFAVQALAARRALELEGMDASLRALKEQIWAAQAKAEEDAKAAKVLEDAANAMKQYQDALANVTETVIEEINRLRGINASSSSVLLKAQFATLTAQARTGNLDALGKLPELSRSIEEATLGTATSALEVARIRAWLAASLSETLAVQSASNATVTTTGAGLTFDGNNTASANTEQTSGELSNMGNMLYNAMYQVAKNTGKSYELMDRWDGDGLPDIREDASDYY